MPGKNLTRDEARTRAAAVTADHYAIDLDLTTSESTFAVRCTLTFAATPGAQTFLDFIGESVQSVTLNGAPVEVRFEDSRIALDGLAETNEVTVEATGRYTNTGEGLHRFVDPVDGEVYLYSQFEVPDARRVYPNFEQPDEKATFAFTVTAPAHWQVLSNAPTPEPTPVRDGVARWAFPTTKRMSTYVTAIVAGPYDVVRDSVTTRGGEVALGLYCRRSLRPFLDDAELLDLTKRGFGYFENEFDTAYPFEKYDQIFTPEYNAGAMENAGCVTFNELYVFRGKVTDAVVERRALTLLHELAHMWFGDLVTMRWWDDLWLNESFAEWASTTAMVEATRYTHAWTTFCTHEKDWAYAQDQLSTTHPVVADMRDLHDIEVNFDGITYAKGASVLKQLVAYVGRDAFREGLRAYFRKHAWGNTTLSDLLVELEATSGRDLRSWSGLWLETAGVNTLVPHVEVDAGGRLTSVVIEQTATEEHPTLRPHRLGIGLYAVQGDALVRTDLLEVDIDGPRTEVPELVGRARPDLLLVNDEDLAYAKIRLDEVSHATALAHPRGFTGSLPRGLVLASLWDSTRDGQMRARDFVDVVLRVLPGESDSTLLKTLLQQLRAAVWTYVAPAERERVRVAALARLWEHARSAEPGSDAQLQLVGSAGLLTTDRDDTAYLRGLLDGSQTLEGLTVDTEMRWSLVIALAGAGVLTGADIDAELAKDDTAGGREKAARARASIPTAESKAAAWQLAVVEDGQPNAIVESTGLGFARPGNDALLEPYVARWVDMLDSVDGKGSHAILDTLVSLFYPSSLADQRLLDAVEGWLTAHPDAPDGLVRLVRENRDSTARALRAQVRDAQPA